MGVLIETETDKLQKENECDLGMSETQQKQCRHSNLIENRTKRR